LGDTVNYIALVVKVYEISGSGIALSTLVLFQIVPVILAGPLAGAIIDRFPRKRVLIAADLARALLVLGLIAAQAVWQLYVLAFCLALASAFFTPAVSASIPQVIEGDDLLAANAVTWSTAQLVQIAGSALSGVLIALAGVSSAFAFNAASFLFSASMIWRVSFPTPSAQGVRHAHRSYVESIREGIRYARSDRFVSRMFLVQLLASLAVGGTSALLVILAERRYGLPPSGFATFLLAIGLGALLGPLVLGGIIRTHRSPTALFLPYLIRGAGDVLLGLFTVPLLGQLLLFMYGLNTSTGMVTYQSAMQADVPDAVRGRVFALMDVGWNMARIVSIALAGILADRYGIAIVYYVGGVLLIGAGALGLTTVHIDERVP
jgi:MFS family permease